ncbi:MAG TPA: hypothetical protein VMM13_19480 [Euzebya sp.]|nr:hypothetical protein [Euzebya sp.]
MTHVVVRVKLLGVAYLVLVGCLVVLGHVFDIRQFNLDSERTVAAGISVAAEGSAAAVVFVGWRRRVLPRYAVGLAIFLGWIAIDNALEIHETLQVAVGIGWDRIYVPFFAIGTALTLGIAWRVRGWSGILFASALACWAGAVVLELLQWTERFHDRFYARMMIVEEIAELTAPLLIIGAVALLMAPHRLRGPEAVTETTSTPVDQ